VDGGKRGMRPMRMWSLFASGKRAQRSQRRPRVVPVWRTRRWLTVSALLAAVVLCGGLWFTSLAGITDRLATDFGRSMLQASARAGFVVREVFVVGREKTPKETLLESLAVTRGMPILAVDLEGARQRIQALPWVRHASVRRLQPDTVIVEIVERRPLALWQHEKKFALIDEDGQVIQRGNVGAFSNLMVVVGENAPENAGDLVRLLATEPDLFQRVRAAVRVGGRRWDVHFADGVDVKLPELHPQAAWRRLAEYQQRHRILDREVQTLDLRLPDRLIVRPAMLPGEVGNDA
jgi:cell division protein FtsQ